MLLTLAVGFIRSVEAVFVAIAFVAFVDASAVSALELVTLAAFGQSEASN